MISDFEREYQMALMNQQLSPTVETVCLMTSYEYAFVSASLVKEVFEAGGVFRAWSTPWCCGL